MSRVIIDREVSSYEAKRPVYEDLAKEIKDIVTKVLVSESIDYYIIQARAKSIESFREKLTRANPGDIRDLAGVRIIGYVLSDVEKISNEINELFKIEQQGADDKSEFLGIDRVGYKSRHFIATLTKERAAISEFKRYDGLFFEIQVRTVLQHAWAEINHDRYYKFSGVLPKEIQRRFNLLAGTLELIDNEFTKISEEVEGYSRDVSLKTRLGKLNIPIDSTSLKQYFTDKFGTSLIDMNIVSALWEELLDELKSMKMETLADFDKILPRNLKNALEMIGAWRQPNIAETIRIVLVAHDLDKYFRDAWKHHYSLWVRDENEAKILRKLLGIDSGKIEKFLGRNKFSGDSSRSSTAVRPRTDQMF